MKSLFVGLFALCLCSTAMAQQSLINGWIELNNGDTLFGKITEKDWNVNPASINFLKEKNTVYSVSQLRSFGIINGDLYKRYTVIRHLLPNRDSDPYPADETKQDTVTVWLKSIVQAEKSLGALYQTDRAYFYFIEHDSSTMELQCSNGTKIFDGDEYRSDPRYKQSIVVENTLYRNQLEALFPDKRQLFDASAVDYNETSLGRLFRKLNNITKSPSAKGSFYMGISAGASLFVSQIGSSYYANYYAGANFKDATQPFVRVSFNFQKAKKRNRISLAPELGLTLFNTTGTKPDVSRNNLGGYDIKNVFLEAGITTRIFLNPAAKNKVFVAAGIVTFIRIAGKNTYNQYDTAGNPMFVNNDPEEPSLIVAPSFSIGYSFTKFGLFANYQHIGNLLTHILSKWTIDRYSLGFSFYFMR